MIVYCEWPGTGNVSCRGGNLFEDAVPLWIRIPPDDICEAQEIVAAVTDWLRAHIVLERRAGEPGTTE
jgi:hypothetical protein